MTGVLVFLMGHDVDKFFDHHKKMTKSSSSPHTSSSTLHVAALGWPCTAFKIRFPFGLETIGREFKQSAGHTRKEDLDADLDDNKLIGSDAFIPNTKYT